MSEQVVQVADASPSTKNMRTIQQTAGGNTVQSEVVVLATGAANGGDTYDARWLFDGSGNPLTSTVVSLKRSLNVDVLAIPSITLSSNSAVNLLPALGGSVVNWDTSGAGGIGASSNELPVSLYASNSGTRQVLQTDVNGFLFINDNYNPGQQTMAASHPVVIASDQSRIPVGQNLLGATDQPDVTVNHSGTLPVSVSNLTQDNQNRLQVVSPYSQNPKPGWGPGWGNFTGW